ncbi:MAG: hypothetical protein WBD04_07720, partial [Candidatus Omnitrophota bacterium]
LIKMILDEIDRIEPADLVENQSLNLAFALKRILIKESDVVKKVASLVKEKNKPYLTSFIFHESVIPWVSSTSTPLFPDEFIAVLEAFKPELLKYREWFEREQLPGYAQSAILLETIPVEFLSLEENRTMLEEKLELVCYLEEVDDGAIVNYVITRFEGEKHSKKLFLIRGLNNVLDKIKPYGIGPLDNWKVLLEYYVRDFGFVTDADLIFVYYHLFKGEPIDGDNLRRYELGKLGVVSTGKDGIEQLKRAIRPILEGIFDKEDIDEKCFDNPIIRALVGHMTGFSSALWGHGSKQEEDLADFVRSFHRKQRLGLRRGEEKEFSAIKEHGGNFEVRRRGRAAFTKDEWNAFENHKKLAKEAASLLEEEDVLLTLKERIAPIIHKQIDSIESNLSRITDEKARESVFRQAEKLKTALDEINNVDSMVKLVETIVKNLNVGKMKDLQHIVALALVAETFSQFPQQKEELMPLFNRGLSVPFLQKIIKLKNEFLKLNILADVEESVKKEALKTFRIKALKTALDRVETASETTNIKCFITRGILGEMAGDIGDACYTAVPDLMNYLTMVGAVLFTRGEGLEKEFAGSMLILENTIGGEKTWILRAVNPREDFISAHSAEDFLKGAIDYVKGLAKIAGVKHIVAPVGDQGAMSNRTPVKSAIGNFVSEDTITLDRPEDLNGYELRNACKKIKPEDTEEAEAGGDELGAQVSNIQKLDRLLKLLRLLKNDDELLQDASDRKIIEYVIEHLNGEDLTEETSYDEDLKIIKIKDEAKETRLGKAIERWAIRPAGGVKAINFQGKDGVWTIVGFSSELADPATLEHEKKEIAYRRQGYTWWQAHERVEEGRNPYEEIKNRSERRIPDVERIILSRGVSVQKAEDLDGLVEEPLLE